MIGEIENAILKRLRDAGDADVLGYRYRAYESMPVDVDERLIEKFQAYPAAGVVFAGWRMLSGGDGYAKVRLQFHLIVCAQNARNEAATRQGAGDDVGSYQLATDAVALLVGQSLGLEIGPLMLGDLVPLYSGAKASGQSISLMCASFTTDASIDTDQAAGSAIGSGQSQGLGQGDFRLFHADWDVPPHGNVAPPAGGQPGPLPDDAGADTVSTVVLPAQESQS